MAAPQPRPRMGSDVLDGAFRLGKPHFNARVDGIKIRLRRARVIYSDETSVRVDGQTHWNWVFRNDDVVIHVVRPSRGAGVVAEVLGEHRPAIWASDLYSAQQGHADTWQVCLAHQLRDCQYAIDAGDTVFAPRMKALLLRAVVLARRRRNLAGSTRLQHRRRLDRDLSTIMALAPEHRDGKRLRKRYGKIRAHLFTFPRPPGGRSRQQQQRARVAADCNLQEGDRWLPIRLGRRPVRRRPIRHRDRSAPEHRRLPGYSGNPTWATRRCTRLSSYPSGPSSAPQSSLAKQPCIPCETHSAHA